MIAILPLLSLALGAAPAAATCSSADAAAVCTPIDEAALRELVVPLLGTLDAPVPPEAWRSLPPEALPFLERMAGEPGRRSIDRARALEGAAALGSDGTVHRRLAADPAAPFVVRAAAVRTLRQVVPAARLGAELAPLLERDGDWRIRAAAAETLAKGAAGTGCMAVRAQVRREPASTRPAFSRALRSCEGR
jgi:hypothetical protein